MTTPTFETLPLEVRRMIYQKLLGASNARQWPQSGRTLTYKSIEFSSAEDQQPTEREGHDCHYEFHTAIMRVSRNVHHEAHGVLYRDNCFITVYCNWALIGAVMRDYDVVPIAIQRRELVAKFNKHVLALHVGFPHFREPSHGGRNVAESFLLVAHEVPRFVRLLRILVIKYRLELCFHIRDYPISPFHAVQRHVLEPFRSLQLDDKECLIIRGAIDTASCRVLRASMVPEARWLRAQAWDINDLLVSISILADEAYRLGDFGCARDKYNDCQKLFLTAMDLNHRLVDEVSGSIHLGLGLCATVYVNAIICGLQLKAYDYVIDQTEAASLFLVFHETLTPAEVSLARHCRSIALASRFKDEEACEQLVEAEKLDPGSVILLENLRITQQRLAATTELSKAAVGTIVREESFEALDKTIPLRPPGKEPCEYIAGERFLMRHYGYVGPWLDDIQETMPAELELMELIIRETKVERDAIGANTSCKLWVGDTDWLTVAVCDGVTMRYKN